MNNPLGREPHETKKKSFDLGGNRTLWNPASFKCLFFCTTIWPTTIREGAMGNETFYCDGLRADTLYCVRLIQVSV